MSKILSLILLGAFIVSGAKTLAATHFAPPTFVLADGKTKAIFVHFKKANYEITFDISKQVTHIVSTIEFENDEGGKPIFDLVDDPTSVSVDDVPVAQRLVDSPKMTDGTAAQFRIVDSLIQAGKHRLVIQHDLVTQTATYSDGMVELLIVKQRVGKGFKDHELYLPVNLPFDQVAMTIRVQIVGLKGKQVVFANGTVSQTNENTWVIQYPNYLNCRDFYFHIAPVGKYKINQFEIVGKEKSIPVTLYFPDNKSFTDDIIMNIYRDSAKQIVADLEKEYGPYLHPALLISGTGYQADKSGEGRDYAGATITDLLSLRHELAHNYFGHGIIGASGNDQWIDEAMSSVNGGPFSTESLLSKPGANMAAHSPYMTTNDGKGYYLGQEFFTYVNQQMIKKDPKRGLTRFFAQFIRRRKHKVFSTEILQRDLEEFYGESLKSLFDKYAYGK